VVPIWSVAVAFVAGLTGLHVGLHHHAHGVVNVHQAGLVFFLVIGMALIWLGNVRSRTSDGRLQPAT